MLLNLGSSAGLSLDGAYQLGNTITVESATGAVRIVTGSTGGGKELLSLERTVAGAGRAIAVTMANGTTGVVLDVDISGTGDFLDLKKAGTRVAAWNEDGQLMLGGSGAPGAAAQFEVYRSSGSILQARTTGQALFEVNAANYVRVHQAGTLVMDLGGGVGNVRDGACLAGASTSGGLLFGHGRTSAGALSTDTYNGTGAGSTKHFRFIASYTAASGTRGFAEMELNPTFNGAATGTAACLAVAPVITAWGGTLNLLDVGTSTTDYFTGYTSQLRVDSNGDMVRGTAAAATAFPQASTTNRVIAGARTVQTTDATVTTVASGTIASGVAVRIFAIVTARRSDVAGETGTYVLTAGGENIGGTTALVGSVATVDSGEDVAGWNATIDFDDASDSWRVRVTGEAAKTIQWTADVRVVAA